jgi:hypothetical protein
LRQNVGHMNDSVQQFNAKMIFFRFE